MSNHVRYVHFRVHQVYETIDGSYYEVAPRAGVTLGLTADEVGRAVFAVSFCSPRDIYNKQIGRSIVQARIQDPESIYVSHLSADAVMQLCKEVMSAYHEHYEDLLEDLCSTLGVLYPAAYMEYDPAMELESILPEDAVVH